MESTALPEDEPTRAAPGQPEWRSLTHLRDRVDAAVREIERLRSQNATLAKRLLEVEDRRDAAPSFAFGEGKESEDLRARVQGFLDVVDDLIQASPAPADAEDDS